MRKWSFITNHGLVLAAIATSPESTARKIGDMVGITEEIMKTPSFFSIGFLTLALHLALLSNTNGASVHSTTEISEIRICWESVSNLTYQVQYSSGVDQSIRG